MNEHGQIISMTFPKKSYISTGTVKEIYKEYDQRFVVKIHIYPNVQHQEYITDKEALELKIGDEIQLSDDYEIVRPIIVETIETKKKYRSVG